MNLKLFRQNLNLKMWTKQTFLLFAFSCSLVHPFNVNQTKSQSVFAFFIFFYLSPIQESPKPQIERCHYRFAILGGGKFPVSVPKFEYLLFFLSLALISFAVSRVSVFLIWYFGNGKQKGRREERENYQRSHEASAESKMYQLQQLGKFNFFI